MKNRNFVVFLFTFIAVNILLDCLFRWHGFDLKKVTISVVVNLVGVCFGILLTYLWGLTDKKNR